MSTAEVLDHAAEPSPKRRQLSGLDLFIKVLQPIASLKLTVTLFALSMLLVFFGTLAQMDNGIWSVVRDYFWSYVVWVDMKSVNEFIRIFFFDINLGLKGSWLPLPAGKTIGGLMFINLLCAHTIQLINLIRGVYKTAQKGKELSEILLVLLKRSGIYILHGGLLLLFVGEYITREFQVEKQMRIAEGSSSSLAYDTRNHELAFLRKSDAQHDEIVVVPRDLLLSAMKKGEKISDTSLPFDLGVMAYYRNSDLVRVTQLGDDKPRIEATAGIGMEWQAIDLPEVSGVDMSSNVDSPSVYVKIYKKNTEEVLATVLASTFCDNNTASKPLAITPIKIEGEEYRIVLRLKHFHKPYQMYLNSFTFEKYVGTELAKNYASHVRLVHESNGVDRLATISMNNPLRYNGETFYQHQYAETPAGKVTTLQVVDNPGWILPYISCVMVTLGMLVHFLIALSTFLSRQLSSAKAPAKPTIDLAKSLTKSKPTEPGTQSKFLTLIPASIIAFLTLFVWGCLLIPAKSTPMRQIAELPVIDGGRVKPLDTVVRTQLRIVSHRETYVDKNKQSQPAIRWYLESAMVNPRDLGDVKDARIFRIENDQVRELLKLEQREGLRYSLHEMQRGFEQFDQAVENALSKDAKKRDLYDNKVLELSRHVKGYFDLCLGKSPLVIPPMDQKPWRGISSILTESQSFARDEMLAKAQERGFPRDIKQLSKEQQEEMVNWLDDALMKQLSQEPVLKAWQDILDAYRSKDVSRLKAAINSYDNLVTYRVSDEDRGRARFEAYLNDAAIFYWCIIIYILGLLLGLWSWLCLVFSKKLFNGVRWGLLFLVLVTCLVHAFMMFSRMYLMERPLVFVTNLYSSAVFIGLVAVMVCIIVEFIFPLGIGNFVACALGAFTCIIAHNLAMNGDTLEMMQAVLDTNLWLATHVTTVTFGYAATYVAGAIALLYLAASIIRDVTEDAAGKAFPLLDSFEKAFGQVIYGIVCLAMLMSFLGTVLGGIWADQSWGRFWGWDPKENGAVLIVIWNALILHARWAGLVKTRGLALLAIVGNMITTWSWFGTNQLSVGLHAYGFDKGLATLCSVLWITHFVAITIGVLWYSLIAKLKSKTAPKPELK
jgi:ABC-type transport system involved in cytochrome c biogenesis permease subunit